MLQAEANGRMDAFYAALLVHYRRIVMPWVEGFFRRLSGEFALWPSTVGKIASFY